MHRSKRFRVDLTQYIDVDDLHNYIVGDTILDKLPREHIPDYEHQILMNYLMNSRYYDAEYSIDTTRFYIENEYKYIIHGLIHNDTICGRPTLIRNGYIVQFAANDSIYYVVRLYALSLILDKKYGYILYPDFKVKKVTFDNSIVDLYNRAVEWYKIKDTIPIDKLYINAKNFDDIGYRKVKEEMMIKRKELTMIYGIDVEKRNRLVEMGIVSYDDERLKQFVDEFQYNIIVSNPSYISPSDNIFNIDTYVAYRNGLYGVRKGRKVTFHIALEPGLYLSWYDVESCISLRKFMIDNKIVVPGLLDYNLVAVKRYIYNTYKPIKLHYPDMLDYDGYVADNVNKDMIRDMLELTKFMHQHLPVDYTLDIVHNISKVEGLDDNESKELGVIMKSIMDDKMVTLKDVIRSGYSIDVKKRLIEDVFRLSRLYNDGSEEECLELYNRIRCMIKADKHVKDVINEREVTLDRILNLNTSGEVKLRLIEKLVSCNDDYKMRDKLYREVVKIEKREDTLIDRIKKSKLSNKIKDRLLFECINIEDDSEGKKKIKWIETWLKIPIWENKQTISTTSTYKQLYDKLTSKFEEKVYGLNKAKQAIIEYIFKPNRGEVIGLCGPKGVGKTHLAQCLSEVLEKPMIRINLGGCSDGAKLIGHSYTYVGSIPGEIVQGLIRSGVPDPIIYIDELDKISSKGREITGILIHALDNIQNHDFVDEYMGYGVDLSHVLWILSFNNMDMIDSILLDRIKVIYVEGYTLEDKFRMVKSYILPQIQKEMNLRIGLSDEQIRCIVRLSGDEEGVRQLKHNLDALYSRLNLWYLTGKIDDKYIVKDSDIYEVIEKKELKLSYYT